VGLVEHEPPDAVAALQSGAVDVALVFEHTDVRHARSMDDLSRYEATTILDDPVHLVTAVDLEAAPVPGFVPDLKLLDDAEWIAGCERCRADMVARCAAVGFAPRIAFETDDYVAVQALVAAGAGVSLLPGLTLRAHRNPGIANAPLPGAVRRVMALTVGPPAPPAAALIRQLVAAGANVPL
jgi:DNA-binding transcriptional LysR family regulator